MTASTLFKGMLATLAAAAAGLVLAQGTPPQPDANAAVGAGQRSSQATPMGTTGTPGGGANTAGGMAAGSGGSMGASGAPAMGTPMGSTSGMAARPDTSSRAMAGTARPARADRN